MKTVSLAKINKVDLLILSGEQELVPIRPICQILGIDEDTQRRKILLDEDLSSAATLRVATGIDGKNYKMFCIPRKFVYGWLFTINPKNVKEESRESLRKFRKMCYDALYEKFELQGAYLQEISERLSISLNKEEVLRKEFNSAKKNLEQVRAEIKEVRQYSFEDWKKDKAQTSLDFSETANYTTEEMLTIGLEDAREDSSEEDFDDWDSTL
jgi:hypothetical protein